MLQFQIDGSEFATEADRITHAFQRTPSEVWDEILATAFDAERQVKLEMPVDTGRARASWGHSTPPADAGDGIWEEDRDNYTVVEGSEVEYIPRLNEGWSQQAPAGFIDAVGVRVQQSLEDSVLDLLVRLWG